MKTALFLTAALLVSVPGFAQLVAQPNALGVSFAHVHINTADIEAQKKFWTIVGGKIAQRDKMTLVEFPGVLIPLRPQVPTGGTVGSTINHFGLHVKDEAASIKKWEAAGLTVAPGNTPGQVFLTGPDGVRIEIVENTSAAAPVQMHHVHLFVTDVPAAQKWYVDHFGAVAGQRLIFQTATVPGGEIAFLKTDMPQTPTKGRAIDHMGFEIRGLDAFVAKLQADGIKTDAPIRESTLVSNLRIVYITDPWGTEVELTEGLAR